MPEPRQRPLPCTSWSVQRILDDAKTQTRRVVRDPARLDGLMLLGEEPDWCPYGRPGDLLWVKESIRARDTFSKARGRPEHTFRAEVTYRADESTRLVDVDAEHWQCSLEDESTERWRSPRFMWKWAARLWLRVESVRVERLQDISEEDAIAEGVRAWPLQEGDPGAWFQGAEHPVKGTPKAFRTARRAFQSLWDSLNGKREGASWNDNRWVWAITFARAEAPKHG
jgi:hypothetical protein